MQLEPSHLTQGHAQKEDIRSSANRSIRPSSSIERDATSLGRGRIGQLVPVPRVSDRRALENGDDKKRRTEENVEHDGKPQKTANSDTGEDIQVEETERQLHLRHERDVEELRDVKVEAKRRQIRLGQRPHVLAEAMRGKAANRHGHAGKADGEGGEHCPVVGFESFFAAEEVLEHETYSYHESGD